MNQIVVLHTSKFVKQRRHTNVICDPNRHALLTTSCINSEVMVYNRKLQKRIKLFNYMKIIESDLKREHLSKHGLHRWQRTNGPKDTGSY